MQIVAMMPRASNDAIRSSTAVLGGGFERADATYQSSVAIVTMGGERRSGFLKGSKRKVAAGAREKFPEGGQRREGRRSRWFGLQALNSWVVVEMGEGASSDADAWLVRFCYRLAALALHNSGADNYLTRRDAQPFAGRYAATCPNEVIDCRRG